MADIKFSQFTDGGQAQVGDIIVGLRSGLNYKFSFPDIGFKDENGNYLLQYAKGGVASVNYPKIISSETGQAVEYTVDGTDTNIDHKVTPKNGGQLILGTLNWPTGDGTAGQAIITDGANQLSFADMASVTLPVVDQTIARFDGTGGNLEDSGVTIDDSDVMSGITQLNVDNLRLDGNTISSTNTDGDIVIAPNGAGKIDGNAAILNNISEIDFDTDWQIIPETVGGNSALLLRAQTGNTNAELVLAPIGAAQQSELLLIDDPNLNNYDGLQLISAPTGVIINSTKAGSGTGS
jgi:hypothetical protein